MASVCEHTVVFEMETSKPLKQSTYVVDGGPPGMIFEVK